jgi:ribosomal protein S18 acetylase RimI-like enzyme
MASVPFARLDSVSAVATVRRAEARDFEAVLGLLGGLGRPAPADDPLPQRNVFLDHLTYDEARVFVAEADGEVVGVASFWFRPRLNWTTLEGWIPDLYVHPGHRRQGIGRALIEACAAEGRRRGCHRLTLESGHERYEAHSLYEACGFRWAGRFYALKL